MYVNIFEELNFEKCCYHRRWRVQCGVAVRSASYVRWEEVGRRLRKLVNASQAGYQQPLSAPRGNSCCTGTS